MKSNAELQQDVMDELRWDSATRDLEIGVAAKDGVVTLAGTVPTYSAKLAVQQAAERVAGVRAMADDVAVRLASSDERSDTELAHAVLNALKWDVDVPEEMISVKVGNGLVSLEGALETNFQRRSVERAVRYLKGVKGVLNHITIEPKPASPVEVTRKIKAALHRSAELDAGRVQIETHDGTVTLKGTVRSWSERTDVERAAWSAPGVRQVNDQLVVGV